MPRSFDETRGPGRLLAPETAGQPGPTPAVRTAAIAAAGVTALIFLGCMSFSIGGSTYEGHESGEVLTQSGAATVPAHRELDVYYPVPYASPPNLTLESGWHECVLVEQKPDHFRLHNPGGSSRTASWTARGVKCLPVLAAPAPGELPAAPTQSPAPADALPPEPIPVRLAPPTPAPRTGLSESRAD